MKSIKPGRGPSMMGGIDSVFAVIFGIIWTLLAIQMGAPFFFPIFGIVFIIMGIVQAIYNFKNATGENRYSVFDIVDSRDEPDPLDERFGANSSDKQTDATNAPPAAFCPYCGAAAGKGHRFCTNCGKELPSQK